MNLKGVNLYLIGMMGCGKSTIGRCLAQQLDYRFFDTDTLIEQVKRQSVAQIFAEAGELAFRELETQVLSELSAYKSLVIATGGGIILDPANWSYMRHGIVVWLDVELEQLHARLQKDATSRPLLMNTDLLAKLQMLLEQRQRFYAQADIQVTIVDEATPEEVTVQVLQAIAKALKPTHSGPT